jgi:hypothetical protein
LEDTQLRNRPSGACATAFSKPGQLAFSTFIPCIGGERKYLGSYLRGDPQKTSRPHEVVPNTKWLVSEQYAPRTTPGVMPGTQNGSLHSVGSAVALPGVRTPAARNATAATTVDRTAPLYACGMAAAVEMSRDLAVSGPLTGRIGNEVVTAGVSVVHPDHYRHP